MRWGIMLVAAMLLAGCNEDAAPKPAAEAEAVAPSVTSPVAPVVAPTAAPAPVASGCVIDEGTARRSAVALLLGDPYGKTAAEVNGNITGISCVDREGEPGKIWRVDVVVPAGGDQPEQIEGFVAVDAVSGEVASIGLPYLD